MKFEKLEHRCLMDGTGFGGACSAFEVEITAPLAPSTPLQYAIYGPVEPLVSLMPQVIEDNQDVAPAAKVDYTGVVTRVSQFSLKGAELVGKQDVPTSTGLRAALDIMEANGGFVQEWASGGIDRVYESGNTFYFEFTTPLEEYLVLDKRALSVDIGDGSIYGFSRW